MFLELLSERQQAVLLHYAHEVMRADTAVKREEQALIETLRAQSRSGVEPEVVPIPDLADVFLAQKGRVAFLLELIGMAYVDQAYATSESRLIGDIAEALDFDKDQLATLESWVQRQFALVQEARLLIEA